MVHVFATGPEFLSLNTKKVVGDFGSPHYWYSQGALGAPKPRGHLSNLLASQGHFRR